MDPETKAALEALTALLERGAAAASSDGADGAQPGGASNAQPNQDGDYPVRLVLAVEGHETSDRRLIAPGALSTRAFPQSLSAQLNPGHGGEPGPSVICGRLDAAERVPGPQVRSRETGEPFPDGTFVWRGTGVLFGRKGDDGKALPPESGSALDLVLRGGLTGNSVDLNGTEATLTFDPEPEEQTQGLGMGAPSDLPPGAVRNEDGTVTMTPPRPPLQTFTKAVLGMTTLVPVPAFAEAYVEVGTGDGWEVITPAVAMADVEPTPFITAELPSDEDQGAVVASGADDPVPPAWWFDRPADRLDGLDRRVPLQFDPPDPETGLRRVWGYVAGWDDCHTSYADRCVPPPRSSSGYASYHYASTMVRGADGSLQLIATGPLTVGGGHASTKPGVSARAAIAHYDDVSTQAGQLRCGEDEVGIWAAGYLWPETSDADVRVMRAAPPSGDWREEYRRPRDMIAVHSVNTPGFRGRPATAYSADPDTGRITALVAAGALAPDPTPPVASGAVILDYDQLADRLAERMRSRGVDVEHVRPDYSADVDGEGYASSDADGEKPQRRCSQNGCGQDAAYVVLTKGDGSPQYACGKHVEGMKDKAGPGATTKALGAAEGDALDLRLRRAKAMADATAPEPGPLDGDDPEEPELTAFALGLALAVTVDPDAFAALEELDDDDHAALEALARKGGKGKGNWVSQTGGLPNLIKRVAKHLQAKGMTESHAIATAVNVVKKYCAKGDLNFPGQQNVSAKTKAAGCAAVADWNRKRAQAKAS